MNHRVRADASRRTGAATATRIGGIQARRRTLSRNDVQRNRTMRPSADFPNGVHALASQRRADRSGTARACRRYSIVSWTAGRRTACRSAAGTAPGLSRRRNPACAARTITSVSQNQPRSSHRSSTGRIASRRNSLNPVSVSSHRAWRPGGDAARRSRGSSGSDRAIATESDRRVRGDHVGTCLEREQARQQEVRADLEVDVDEADEAAPAPRRMPSVTVPPRPTFVPCLTTVKQAVRMRGDDPIDGRRRAVAARVVDEDDTSHAPA